MAVPKDDSWDWGWGTSTSSCTNSFSDYKVINSGISDYLRRDREHWLKRYYSEYRYNFGMEKPPINNFFKEEIANRPIKYTNIEEKIDPIQAVKFDPENLWSKPKCLKIDIAQPAKQKSHSGITSKINISGLKKES